MKTLLVARHGESEFSAKQLVNGDPGVRCPLTETGRAQARALGAVLAREPLDLVAVTEFERVRETAELAVGSRGLPFLVVPELNEPRFGRFEGGPAHDYGVWAWESGPLEASHGGEHRGELAARYARGFRLLLDRPEESTLLIAHSVTLRYLLEAAEGRPPSPRVEAVEYATVVSLSRSEVARAVELLDAWAASPAW